MAITNILLTTFAGCASSPTICIPLPSNTTTDTLFNHISSVLPTRLPHARLVLTTTSNHRIALSATATLASLQPHNAYCTILPLRLSAPLPGGKGGFGSQLRAAGGRMSSRKKRSAEAQNGSNRNLDGRRLRTITEAKNLATYLATKPEMDRREKEERRKRWEAVVEAAERREEEIRNGKKGKGLSEEWMVEKEEVGEGVRDAVKRAMMGSGSGGGGGGKIGKEVENDEGGSGSGSGASAGASEEDSEVDAMELDDEDVKKLEDEAAAGDVDAIWVLKHQVVAKGHQARQPQARRYAGFDDDDDDEFLSSDGEVDTSSVKGKAKA
jgi:hypothetical protein